MSVSKLYGSVTLLTYQPVFSFLSSLMFSKCFEQSTWGAYKQMRSFILVVRHLSETTLNVVKRIPNFVLISHTMIHNKVLTTLGYLSHVVRCVFTFSPALSEHMGSIKAVWGSTEALHEKVGHLCGLKPYFVFLPPPRTELGEENIAMDLTWQEAK